MTPRPARRRAPSLEGAWVVRAGDVLIQRGTNHAWANRSGRPARVAFVLVDGRA